MPQCLTIKQQTVVCRQTCQKCQLFCQRTRGRIRRPCE
jgi:hypothetical protein